MLARTLSNAYYACVRLIGHWNRFMRYQFTEVRRAKVLVEDLVAAFGAWERD